MNLVAEIAHEQYDSALVIRHSCTCESTSTSSTDNIEIIQATLNGASVNSYYKPHNQAFDFRSSTTDTPLQVILVISTVIAQNGDTDPQMMTETLVERWCDANSLTIIHDPKLPKLFNSAHDGSKDTPQMCRSYLLVLRISVRN